ncbi:MAG: ribonuclease HII [Treponema sp.]|jgi:ribonuclease HII|nr:ribonuclease HII [Treponema sp.]
MMKPRFICGIDEAGRGPLAGPVCAASVILPPEFPLACLDDSKKLKAPAREKARIIIMGEALAWGIGWASAAEIDRINILRASLLAMERSFEAMVFALGKAGGTLPEGIGAVADGLYVPRISIPCTPMVRADAQVPAVMAASILAKTARDRMMIRYDWLYPRYGYEKHKGYPTAAHRAAIAAYGPSPIQRMSFRVSQSGGGGV